MGDMMELWVFGSPQDDCRLEAFEVFKILNSNISNCDI